MQKQNPRPMFDIPPIRPYTTWVKYLQEELEIRTRGMNAAASYISDQIPNKTGSASAMILAFTIGLIGGIIITRYLTIPSIF